MRYFFLLTPGKGIESFMRCYYGLVLENYLFRTETKAHIAVILETYIPEAFTCFVAVMSVAVLETDTEMHTIYSKQTLS